MIDEGKIESWKFVVEEGKTRLLHKPSSDQYDKVVLRFINTYIEGESHIKILPTMRIGETNISEAKAQMGVVLGRFAELINCHFPEIECYTTILNS